MNGTFDTVVVVSSLTKLIKEAHEMQKLPGLIKQVVGEDLFYWLRSASVRVTCSRKMMQPASGRDKS